MRDTGILNGLSALGYGEADVPGLVEGALKQHGCWPAARAQSALTT